MSISYTKVKSSSTLKKSFLYGAKEFVRVTIDRSTDHHLSLPADYKFSECFLTKKYVTLADRILNFPIRADDVWTVSFPKAGTTWIMNIVWLLKHNLDFSADIKDSSYKFLERSIIYDINEENNDNEAYKNFVERLNRNLDEYSEEPSPRLLKSHLPAYLLPKSIWTVKPKLIYVYRDVKDIVVSMYHMYRNSSNHRYEGTIEDFFDANLNDQMIYAPFYGHVNSFKQLNHLNHLLLLKYEEMLAQPFSAVKRISEFLNCTYSEKQLQQLTEHISFDNMRNKYTNLNVYPNGFNFFRKGTAGGYRDEMSSEYVKKFDEWQRKHTQ